MDRLRFHGGKGLAKHNDRSVEVHNADIEKSGGNRYWMWNGGEIGFEESEKAFYEQNYGKQLEKLNQSAVQKGHPERVQSLDEFYNNPRYLMHELVVGFGNVDHVPCSADELWNIYCEWHNAMTQKYRCVQILTVAEHVDEPGADHLHVRYVVDFVDKDGILKVGLEKGLEQAGVPLPHPDKKPGRYNNRLMTLTREARKLFFDLAEARGIILEREPIYTSSKDTLNARQYQNQKEQEKLLENQQKNKNLKKENTNLELSNVELSEKVEISQQTIEKQEKTIQTNNNTIKAQNDSIKAQKELISEMESVVEGFEYEYRGLIPQIQSNGTKQLVRSNHHDDDHDDR